MHDKSLPGAAGTVDPEAVSTVLRSHPAVLAANVHLTDDGRLVAHVVPTDVASVVRDAEETVDTWRTVFDDCYRPDTDNPARGTAPTAGWTDSLSGRPIPETAMAEWVATTAARILPLQPRSVLELGAGTGMIMAALGRYPGLREYAASDVSTAAVRVLTEQVERLGAGRASPAFVVRQAQAASPPPPSARGGYDVAVLNSVVQYFPSTAYLESALRAVLPVMRPGGHIFLGDLRDESLLGAFACLKHHRRAAAGTEPGRITGRIRRELARDSELSVSPEYLHALPGRINGITAVATAPRRGTSPTEMTLFRYDAVLHVGCGAPMEEERWREGRNVTADAVGRRLARTATPFGYRAIPNSRLNEAHRLQREYGMSGPVQTDGLLDPESMCAVAEQHGWFPALRWTPGGNAGEFDVWLSPPGASIGHFGSLIPWEGRDEAPRHGMFPPRIERDRKTDIANFVSTRLRGRVALDEITFTERMIDPRN